MEKEFYEAGKNYQYQIIEDKYKNFIFLRGMFEKFGQISKRNLINSKLYCTIRIFNSDEENNLSEYLNFFHLDIPNNKYIFKELNDSIAFDFLINLYKDSDARYRDNKFYRLYLDWITNVIPSIEIKLINKKAVMPYKNNVSDNGMNLTIIKEYKKINLTTIIYDTGVIAIPDFGFCVKVIPHNDLILKGYMLLLYENEKRDETVKIVLIKTDRNVKKIELPYCCCKMIIEKNYFSDYFEKD